MSKKQIRILLGLGLVLVALLALFIVLSLQSNRSEGPAPEPIDETPIETGLWQTAGEGYVNLYAAIQEIAENTASELSIDVLDGEIFYDEGSAVSDAPTDAASPAEDDMNRNAVMGGDGGPLEADESAAETELGTAGTSATEDYSDTNVQVEGVDEADIVKTDGEYIYTINSQNLAIIEANDGEPELTSKIAQPLDDSQIYFEMFVHGDRLIAIRQGLEDASAEVLKVQTSADVFDISDKAEPKKLHSLTQSGSYKDSRMVGEFLYLISEYTEIDPAKCAADEPITFAPLYFEDGSEIVADPDDIYLRPNVSWPTYTNVSGIDTAAGSFVSQKAIFGATETVYAKEDVLYLAASDYISEETSRDETYKYFTSKNQTQLCRMTLSDGEIEVAATGAVVGILNDQFSLDAAGGVLRVVVTDSKSTWGDFITPPAVYTEKIWEDFPESTNISSNALYTLDGSFDIIGSAEGLAEGEQVYSCRFIGDTCYFVTFKQVDPLFSVDVSDPENPTVLGALKIPGFSEYLHPYSSTLLLGLGNDANADTGATGNLKLSMFDMTEPSDVSEKDKLVIEGHMYSEASQNHKAIVVDAERGLIAFPADGSYLIYEYSEDGGFVRKAEISQSEGNIENEYIYSLFNNMRGLFIGDVFYVLKPNTIAAYDMKADFRELSQLAWDEGAHSVSRWEYGGGAVMRPLLLE